MKKKIKKVITLVLIMAAVLHLQGVYAFAADTEAPQEPEGLYARSAVLMDADSGRVLFGKEETAVRPMASTTKIMTCIVALEYMEEGQTVTASGNASGQPKVRLGVKEGEEFYLSDLLYSLMLESHNDSAVVIAEGIAGTVGEFARIMNQKAEEMGCTDTHFVTPNGLDAEDEEGVHSTTARDLARIMKYCITESPKKGQFLEITRTKTYSFGNVAGDRQFTCNNHNAFLDMMEGALTGKTGFTGDAGYCYVGALENGGRTFIVALLACGWPNNKGYKWQDTRKLMEYGIAAYTYQNVWKDMDIPPVEVKNGVPRDDEYERKASVPVEIAGGEPDLKILLRADEKVEIQCHIKDSLKAPAKKGQKAGNLIYRLNGSVIRRYDIRTTEAVEERTFTWCFQKMMKEFFFACGS